MTVLKRIFITLSMLLSATSGSAIAVPLTEPSEPGEPIELEPRAQAEITDTVTNLGNDTWKFEYTVENLSECSFKSEDGVCFGDGDAWLDSWALPYFDDAELANISSPDKWAYSIETIGIANEAIGWDGVAAWQDPSDPNYQGANSPFTTVEEVLVWYANEPYKQGYGQTGISPEESLGGFSFESAFGATKSPHQTTFYFTGVASPRETISGDPSFPNSPSVSGTPVSVPEPGTIGLLSLALAGIWVARRLNTA